MTRHRPAVVLLVAAALLAACGAQQEEPRAGSGSADPLDLRGVCPATVRVQTSWEPSAESFGALYALVGPQPTVDAAGKRVTGPLVAGGRDTGVRVELRAGGPAIGFEQATTQLYARRELHLAVPSATDEVIQRSRTQPTVAVLALVDVDPQMILWDPATYPRFRSIADIGRTDTKVVYFGGDTYMEYLTGSGILKRDQVDGSFDGSPARFVAARGAVAQAGYATGEPFLFRSLPQWGKPIRYQLVAATGYPNYGSVLSVRTGDKAKLAPCLSRLVPIVQQAQVDVATDAATRDRVVDLTLRLSGAFKATRPYTRDAALDALRQERDLELVSNGSDATIGNFDPARLAKLIGITAPIFAAQRNPVKDGLTPTDVATNEFTRPIGLP